MAWLRTRKTLLVIGVALLLCTGLAIAEACFFHTDDGCAVEVHCVACCWVRTASGFSHTVVLALPAVSGSVQAPPSVTPPIPDHDFASPALSRGPPAS